MSTSSLIGVGRGRHLALAPLAFLVAFSSAGGCGGGTLPLKITISGDDGGSSSGGGSASSGSGGTSSGGSASGSSGGTSSGGSGGSGGPCTNCVCASCSARIDAIIGGVDLTGAQSKDATDWKFNKGDATGAEALSFDDTGWTAVTMPHTWNNMDGEAGSAMHGPYYRGIGWYRTHYMIPPTMMGKTIYLQFDESAYVTDAFVNGQAVGTHSGGYAAFRFDITSAAIVGMDNVIAVKVDNSQAVTPSNTTWIGGTTADVAPISGDFTMFGGIERNVHVLATNPLAISPMDFGGPGVYLTPSNVTAASSDLTVTVKLLNSGTADANATVTADILDAKGKTVQTLTGMQTVPPGAAGATAILTGKVTNPHLWNGLADPYVYHANISVSDGTTVTDGIQQPLGFRWYTLDPNNGFSLNGNPYHLHGVCAHQDHKDKGGVFSPADIDNDFVMIKEIGANVVRFAHYQHSDYTYTKADQAGIVTWAENAFVNRIPQYCASQCTAFTKNTQDQLTELIRQNYNHPAIFFWSLGNEVLIRTGPNPTPVMQNLANVGAMEDPTRTIAYAANAGSDTSLYGAADWTPQATFFNEYQGWYYQFTKDFAPWADAIHQNHPTTPVGVSEYGAGANPLIHAVVTLGAGAQSGVPVVGDTGADHTNKDQTEEYQAFFHEVFYQAILTRPFLVGTMVWNMFDFASDYRNEGNLPGLNTKGLVTYDRSTKKDAFFYYKANWKDPGVDPVVYIASRRFTTLPKSSTTIKVYSNLPSVDVKLNGTDLGMQTSTNHIFLWNNVKWVVGANKVDASGGTTTDSVTFTN